MSQEKNDLLKKNIVIEGCETKKASNGNFFSKIKDDQGTTYMLFHTKKDGTDSMAYKGFKELPMSGLGCKVEISYKEEQYEFEGKEFTSRKLMNVRKPTEDASTDDVKIADGSIIF